MARPRSGLYLKLATAVAILLALFQAGNAQSNLANYAGRVVNDIFKPEKYDKQVRPAGTNESTGPVIVYTNMYVRSIDNIDDKDMEFSVQLTFRQMWKDERLKFNDLGGQLAYVIVENPDKLWLPDPFFSNEISGSFHNIIKPNVLVRIYHDGRVLYSVRVSLKLSCPMNLKNFPFDRQTCSIMTTSYAHTTEDIVFLWRQGDPVQVTRNLHLSRFSLTSFLTSYCSSKTNTGEYSCLRLDLLFDRERNGYMINVYLPCIMCVLVSWVVLWISNKNTAVRVFVPLVVLLVMAMFISKLNQDEFPRTSYTKAVDTWTGVCLTFVFFVLVYVTAADYIVRVTRGVQDASASPRDESKVEEAGKPASGSAKTSFLQSLRAWMQRPRSLPDKMDIVARIAFPLCFVLFLIIYFSVHAGSNVDE
ncbi:glutamate-gated chloride channel-like isoform X2 [Dermacentor silvarum]|uniref:glutamate-gated chloride channel-like isoform X2 n=1 Tax=Dermacentor silvarum TaxID=543639 RepID=UPI001898877E|nr:glutamate-gated chloride channel-like isoform X2 [Dermacentor silvarum]XP_049525298.1 glutamate-gated chloride channel-like isoform X2 [Dermacentor silvarum]